MLEILVALLVRVVIFINQTLVPFVFAVSLLLFIYGVYLYFFQDRSADENLKNGRQYMIWAVLAFVLMVSVWGLVNLIAEEDSVLTATPLTLCCLMLPKLDSYIFPCN